MLATGHICPVSSRTRALVDDGTRSSATVTGDMIAATPATIDLPACAAFESSKV